MTKKELQQLRKRYELSGLSILNLVWINPKDTACKLILKSFYVDFTNNDFSCQIKNELKTVFNQIREIDFVIEHNKNSKLTKTEEIERLKKAVQKIMEEI